jgi:hypothetical protein
MASNHLIPRSTSLLLVAALVATIGCKGKGDSADEGDDGGTTLAGGGQGVPECGGAAPVISEVQCSADGMKEYEPGSSLPTLLFEMFVEDEDADLSAVGVQLYYDDVIDGVVSTQDPDYPLSRETIDADPCNRSSLTFRLNAFVSGVNPRFNTNYEWGIVIRDAGDVASEMYILECITPFENGDAGNGEG